MLVVSKKGEPRGKGLAQNRALAKAGAGSPVPRVVKKRLARSWWAWSWDAWRLLFFL